jgi:hypothetical protein
MILIAHNLDPGDRRLRAGIRFGSQGFDRCLGLAIGRAIAACDKDERHCNCQCVQEKTGHRY